MGKKIGLFGGTFDPIHLGHLNLAIELKEKRLLDEVWFIPAYISPFKTGFPPALAQHRLKMIQLALQEFTGFYVTDLELNRPPPSFTMDTIRSFCESDIGDQSQYFWLMGEDHLATFHHWYQWQEILKSVTLLIGSRFQPHSMEKFYDECELNRAIQIGWTKTRLMDISSTDVRQRLAENLVCSHLLPSAVIQYIRQNQLYELKG